MKQQEVYSIKDGHHEISFELKFSTRKSLGICVTPKSEIQVTAPEGLPVERVLQSVKRRMPWIIKQLKGLEKIRFVDTVPDYESGQTIRLLGRDYMLKVLQVEDFEEETVSLEHSILKLTIHDRTQKDRINLMVEEWYRNEALLYLGNKFEMLSQKVVKYGLPKPQYYLRKMEKRWGSCTPNGVIYLNPEMIKLPSHCIEYVIMHELCHLKFPDHSTEYYHFLETVMPDWKLREKDLNG